ncbi:uncharacterized protein LOC132039351 [Lycium ferocissimum]|uniref:uncharacterized protein LOC132039351 n=1 Tax=Lycium ferocissimum TaxID=112874 RepID=UPI0028163A5A|nr:uncharacterized protein LOC132039351 [Lycium ferocissimum]
MVAISEPMVHKNKVEGCKRFLGFNNCITNSNRQIWCFSRDSFIVSITKNQDQLITLKIQKNNNSQDLYVTVVYAKCTAVARVDLWCSLEDLNNKINIPWCIVGDFNVILHPEEKIGGRPHRNANSFDFTECMDSCGMSDIGYTGSNYTWCNNRRPRLDHRPMLFRCGNGSTNGKKYFKFLDFLTDQEDFKDIIAAEWIINVNGNPLWRLQQKLKNLGRKLSQWSRDEIGNVHENTDEREDKMQFLEEINLNSRSKGDSNTKYFHYVIRERRRKLQLHRIKNKKGKWITGDNKIARCALKHFEKLFNLKNPNIDPSIMECIPTCISDEITTL